MPAVDIDKKPWFLTTRPTVSFLAAASLTAGAYIALNNPKITSPAVAAPAPAVTLCAQATAENPAPKCVKIDGLKR